MTESEEVLLSTGRGRKHWNSSSIVSTLFNWGKSSLAEEGQTSRGTLGKGTPEPHCISNTKSVLKKISILLMALLCSTNYTGLASLYEIKII